MGFLNLWAFWIAAGVVPTLLILYFLKLRRREELVPSTLLWKRAVQDLQVNAPFQKLRKNLLLLLQLLLLSAGIIALARPVVESEAAREKSLILMIDRSASMNAVEEGQTRAELAREQAVRLVKTLNRTGSSWFTFGGAKADTRVMVIAFADRATVVSPFTTNTSDLIELIENITPTDARTNMREALALAEAYTIPTRANVESAPDAGMQSTPDSSEAGSKIILYSDGGVGDLSDSVLRSGSIELHRIGQTRSNVAITALRTQRNYEQPELINTFLQVRNYGPKAVTTDVSLYLDGGIVAAKSVTLAPGAAPGDDPTTQPAAALAAEGSVASLSFPGELQTGGVLDARLSVEDALSTDNRALVVVPPPRKLRVLVVTERNFFWESVLRGLPLESVDTLTPAEYDAAPAESLAQDGRSLYDVVIFLNHNAKDLPAGAYLFVRGVPEIPEIKVGGEELGMHALMWWDDAHPVLRHVSLDAVFVGSAITVQAPQEAETLIEGPAGPTLLRYARDGRHYMILTFAVEQSTWWNRPSFPIFAYNALRYLGSGGAVADQGATRPGETLRIQLPAGETQTTVHRPDGEKVTVTADAGGVAHYGGTSRAGLYRVEPGVEGRDRFAVNLEDETESDITPRGVSIGGEAVVSGEAIDTATPEVWRWFIGAALVVALIEWYIYNRRVMI